MQTSFHISDKNLEKLKSFVATLPSAKYTGNPEKQGKQWSVTVSTNLDEGGMLNEFINKLSPTPDILNENAMKEAWDTLIRFTEQ
jgi:hypothetical protein